MKILYICEGCKEQYDSEDEAKRCEAIDPGPRLVEVGDIVTAHSGFGWYDGDSRWIRNPDVLVNGKRRATCPNGDGNCFSMCCTYGFFYVVIAIDIHDHRVRYHLATRAMNGKQGYRTGYTYNECHIIPKKVKNPPEFLRRSGRGLIGKKTTILL